MKEQNTPNPILDKSFEFAVGIIEFCRTLKSHHHYSIQDQLIRSGTAIGALVKEAQSPESRKDFIHKLKIAMKEAEETEYWLELCRISPHLPNPDKNLLNSLIEIQKILSRIIISARSKL